MGIYQYSYNGRMRRYDVELFHITGSASDVSVVAKPPKVLNPPVAPSPGSSTLGFLDEISTTKADVATLELDLQDVDSLVTKLYNTFQPVGDDFGSTKITYEESKLDGMNVELTQGQITMASSSGNTFMGLRESSPGTWDLYLQDDATPTPNSVLTMTATAAGGIGLVGINTETPTAPLEVTGAVKITGSITITGTVDGVDVSALKTTVDGLSVGTGDTSNFWAFYLAD
jgi:ethanolamine utilization microcompartment shell protein EutS